MEEAAASRERLLGDIEAKFTDYLRNYNENVTSEIHELNQRLSESTNELAEYQVELMVAAREDEGFEMRIPELERTRNHDGEQRRPNLPEGHEDERVVRESGSPSSRTVGQHRRSTQADGNE